MKTNPLQQLLHQVGLKFTPGRAGLLELLMEAETPLTHDEISQRLNLNGLNKVSIYRALASFLEVGLVHRVESGDRIWKYAFCGCGSQGHCHPHFICRSCGKVECWAGVKLPIVEESKSGYIVQEREIYLRGLCPSCC